MAQIVSCHECGARVALTDEGLLAEHLMPSERPTYTASGESGQAPCGSSGAAPAK